MRADILKRAGEILAGKVAKTLSVSGTPQIDANRRYSEDKKRVIFDVVVRVSADVDCSAEKLAATEEELDEFVEQLPSQVAGLLYNELAKD